MLKIPHAVIVRAPGLLPMLYKVSELADELDIPERTLRDWLAGGAPCQKGMDDHIWVNGELFSQWVTEERKPRTRGKMSEGKAFCLRCKESVPLNEPIVVPIKGKLIHIRGACPQCGSVINRGGRIG